MTAVRIVVDDLASDQVRQLIGLHLAAMHRTTPPESVHALGLDRLRDPDVTVWTAWDGDTLLGMGALHVEAGSSEGEIKSMRTDPAHLGRGVGRAILRHIIDEARQTGVSRLSLETGSGAPFAAAHHLYGSEGFVPCGPFGSYTDDPHSRFFTLALEARDR